MIRNILRTATMSLCFLSVACGYDNGDRRREDPAYTPDVISGMIDTDAKLTDVESGVGVFIEYTKGGTWSLRVGCDTAINDAECFWQIYAYTPVGIPITSFQSVDLEKGDILSLKTDGELWLDAKATVDLDGATFSTEPGEPMTFDVYLDGDSHPEDFIYYINGGKVVNGTKSPVIELTPTEP